MLVVQFLYMISRTGIHLTGYITGSRNCAKCDMERNRVVSLDEAEKYASTVGATHFSTSAKMNKNVRELFDYIARNLTAKPQPDTGGKGSDDDEPIRIGEPRTDTNDGGCC
ncbi:hypothetical protein Pelo_19414 [Pelomyxa schiedti]|nr:hypothetical protein Pelo_19414 [Pelomyxa schiedti]